MKASFSSPAVGKRGNASSAVGKMGNASSTDTVIKSGEDMMGSPFQHYPLGYTLLPAFQ